MLIKCGISVSYEGQEYLSVHGSRFWGDTGTQTTKIGVTRRIIAVATE
jgi:hypothetical protein